MTHTPRLHRVRDQRALADEKTCRLNKAAPDMLEALETIMDIGDKACRDIARAAIRKARGEE
jgi:hypothetical protein